ncbi:MAG TPA: ADP-heptose synthase [Verrucomicrobiales bacterium]|mgnify:FL=1|nr:ADP-heptose synthase [Verrucomicrobiales bacterium]
MNFSDKILTAESLFDWRDNLKRKGQRLAATNGCFDILHTGHINYLQAARNAADALIVGINSDRSVKELKGPTRPIQNENDRAAIIAALQSVDGVYIFDELRATKFLELTQPDLYVKGGDYSLDELPEEERQLISKIGAELKVLGLVSGKSSSDIADRIIRS